MELGVKIAFIKESKYIPQIGPFIMFEIPTGNYDKGLGVGKVWYKVPLWLQKKIGNWLLDGGGGETIVPQTQYRNFPYGSFLLKYTFGDLLHALAGWLHLDWMTLGCSPTLTFCDELRAGSKSPNLPKETHRTVPGS
jgi:hypothetical protein